MKSNLTRYFRYLQRSVSVVLLLLPSGALVWSYWVVEAVTHAANTGRLNPEMTTMFVDIHSFFQNIVIPILIGAVVLAALNLLCCLAAGYLPKERQLQYDGVML